MDVVPLAPAFDLPTLKRLIIQEGDVNVDNAVFKKGSQNAVVETDDWMVRFPVDESASITWEADLLTLIRGQVDIETPDVQWLGTHARCMAYPKIRGARFDRHAYVEAPSSTRDALASSLADTLVGLQDALARRSESAGLTTADFTKFYTPLREHLSDFPPGARPHISDLLDESAELFLSGTVHDHVAMHNDFHFDNLVLDAPLGRVVGVWDFSCVSTGSPEWDLRYFEADLASPWETPVHARGQHHDLLRRVSREYETLRGLDVNVRASVVANRVEALCDLWVDGAPKAIRGWTEWDAHAR